MFGKKRKISKTVKTSHVKQQGIKLFIDKNAYITVKTGNCSHQGARECQEDSFGYSGITESKTISDKGFVAVLADGMGGLLKGKDISKYVVSSFIKMFDMIDYNASFPMQLNSIVVKINDEVCRNFSVEGRSGAGSTMASAFVYKTKLYWICIGDSRLYLMRNGLLYAVNEDHDYFNQLLSNNLTGKMSIEEINLNEQKDRLTSYIGSEKLSFIDANHRGFSIYKGDILVLCSDGIYNGINDAEMIGILKQNEPQRASEKITRTVLNKNIAGQDNLTVMVIKFEE